MDAKQLGYIIKMVLDVNNLYTPAAVQLLLLTAAVESNLGEYVVQMRGGPARGIFQMEPFTERDIHNNYLNRKPTLMGAVHRVMGQGLNLMLNLEYQILMARIHYLRKPEPLPAYGDIKGMAAYWKKHYNTDLGKGTVEDAIKKYNLYVGV